MKRYHVCLLGSVVLTCSALAQDVNSSKPSAPSTIPERRATQNNPILKDAGKDTTLLAEPKDEADPKLQEPSGARVPGRKIFNGKNLKGWIGNPDLWSVKDGVIVGQTTEQNPVKANTFLIWTNGTTENFELTLQYKITPNNDKGAANSGIQYRSKVLDTNNWIVGGYQADFEAGDKYSGILYEEKMDRGIMAARGEKVTWTKDCKKEVTGTVGKSEDIQASIKKDDWNDYKVVARGNRLQHFINGKPTADITDECKAKAPTTGVLALQLHTGPPMTVMFKEIRLKKLK